MLLKHILLVMSLSTPIGALRRDEDQDPGTRDMVDGIVRELDDTGYQQGLPGGGGGGQYEDFNGGGGGQGGYGMDYGVPPGYQGGPMMPSQDPRDFQQGPPQHHGGQMEQPMYPPQQQMGGGAPQGGNKGFMSMMTDYAIMNSKEPMLAAALYVLMSNDAVSALISRYIPYASTPLLGLAIRAVIVAVLFMLGKVFVLKR